MIKKIWIALCLTAIILSVVETAQAQLVNYGRRRFRQQNNAQAVTTTTTATQTVASVAGDSPSWMTQAVEVQYSSEQRFDFNRDGFLQKDEVIAFLEDLSKQVKAKGSAVVMSNILKEYDKNGDYSIDRTELKAITRDIGK